MRTETQTNPKALWGGLVASIVLLLVFFVLKHNSSNLLELPVQWLFVAVIPLLVGLIVGGYVRDIKAGDYCATFNAEQILQKSDLIADSASARCKSPEKAIPPGAWQADRAREYARTHGYMLAHIYRPSTVRGQAYDISVFVMKHEKGSSSPPRKNLKEIESAEFFFGESWGNQVFPTKGDDGFFGVRTHAWGTFLAACRIVFKDEAIDPVVLYRYVDFSMTNGSDET
jgi:hypothetical protein